MKKKFSTQKIALIGIMTAAVFVFSHLQIPLPAENRIHLGNVMCLLSGFLLGPIGGGLAAGLGSGLFDLTSNYVASFPFTVVFKFLMAFVCGKIAYAKDNKALNTKLNFLAGASGALTYVVLYVGKNFIKDIAFLHLEMTPALLKAGTKLLTSGINGLIAVLVAVPLAKIIGASIRRAGIKMA